MESPAVNVPTTTLRPRTDLIFSGSSSKPTWLVPTELQLCRSSSRLLYVKCLIDLTVARQQEYRECPHHCYAKHDAHRHGITSKPFPKQRNKIRKPCLRDRINGQDHRHGSRQRVDSELIGCHERNQHIVGAHCEAEQKREDVWGFGRFNYQ